MRLPSVKQAFALHFLLSLLVFLVLLALMMRVWYPGELFALDGGWQGLKIIAPVDLVLGPALTLLLYRPWKKTKPLIFDMTTIAVIQIAALSFGVYSAYNQRTAAIVFADHRFETISLNEYRAANIELLEKDLQPKLPRDLGKMPAIVYATPYENLGLYLEDVLNGMPELRERSDLYQPISESMDLISAYGVDKEGNPLVVEIPAAANSAKPNVNAQKPPTTFAIKARYGHAIINLQEDKFEIQKIGH